MKTAPPPKNSVSEKARKAIRVHPELWRVFGSQCRLDGISMEDKIHAILCRELDRPDLLHHPDDEA